MLRKLFVILLVCYFIPPSSSAQKKDPKSLRIKNSGYVAWYGTQSRMTFAELASYCAPVFWFSPDEPELNGKSGKDITIPEEFKFQPETDTPVVYYQIREILLGRFSAAKVVKKDYSDPDKSEIDLSMISAFTIDYTHYYKFEQGLGGHDDDTEQAQFNFSVKRIDRDGKIIYLIILVKAVGKAHALVWYDNIFTIDETLVEIKLPFHILVEEGKHASCTDVNADGYYTPGYDVNNRENDAWGVRDVIRVGKLFSSGYQDFMSKIRLPQHRVFPPLPEDSYLREKYTKNGKYAEDNAIYQLRPMPGLASAMKYPHLMNDMKAYTAVSWPRLDEGDDFLGSREWFEKDLIRRSLSVSATYDGGFGMSFVFPLLIVKNVEGPLTGGWIVNRIYLKDKNFRDIGYNLLLTPSASRFTDPYFAAGIELDSEPSDTTNTNIVTKGYFVLETGVKFRGNVTYSPLKFLSFITEFWGLRIGIRNRGFPDISKLQYNIEIGAGVW